MKKCTSSWNGVGSLTNSRPYTTKGCDDGSLQGSSSINVRLRCNLGVLGGEEKEKGLRLQHSFDR
ncbi:unnamed protein product [Malus baccata var. baccata]|uniref:Uncharacterized protein n=1 Tax=Malus domestica TaxID=3750 RepID=A0A498K243_MALDO|nr:hypothetical protein DVH24_021604 [Malus domestica]